MLTNVSKNCKYEISRTPKSFSWEFRFCDGLADGHAEAKRLFFRNCFVNVQKNAPNIHSFISLSYDKSKASSKASSPHSAIQSFLLQMRVSSFFLNP